MVWGAKARIYLLILSHPRRVRGRLPNPRFASACLGFRVPQKNSFRPEGEARMCGALSRGAPLKYHHGAPLASRAQTRSGACFQTLLSLESGTDIIEPRASPCGPKAPPCRPRAPPCACQRSSLQAQSSCCGPRAPPYRERALPCGFRILPCGPRAPPCVGPELLPVVGPELFPASPELLPVGPELLPVGPYLLPVGPE